MSAPHRVPSQPDETLADIAATYNQDPDDVLHGVAQNRNNAAFAARALAVYEAREPCDTEECLADLLTDLRHLADWLGLDFDALAEQSERYHTEEIGA